MKVETPHSTLLHLFIYCKQSVIAANFSITLNRHNITSLYETLNLLP